MSETEVSNTRAGAPVWPQVVSAVSAALAAIAAAVAVWFAFAQVSDARRNTGVQAVALLSSQTSQLYDRFKAAGIDDVPRLSAHLYLLITYHDLKIISDDFYVIQARIWCQMTRSAAEKLKLYWRDDQNFRKLYSQTPHFLELLDALTDISSKAPKECL